MVSARTVSQDNEWMASRSADTTIILWCLKERRLTHQWVAHRGAVTCLAFSPDSQKLLSGSRLDPGITIWDVSLPQGVQKILVLKCFDSSPEACAWSPARSDRESLVACAFPRNGRTFRIWDVHTLQLRTTFRHAGAISASSRSRRTVGGSPRMEGMVHVPSGTSQRAGYIRSFRTPASPSTPSCSILAANGLLPLRDVVATRWSKFGTWKLGCGFCRSEMAHMAH